MSSEAVRASAPFAGAPSRQAQKLAADFADRKRHAASLSIEERRQQIEALVHLHPVPVDVSMEEASPGGVPSLRLIPSGADEMSTIVYFHGGGYTRGSARAFANLGARLATAAGTTAVMVDYRLAPEDPFPAAFDDALAACRAVLARFDPGRVALAGDSAGGGLAVATSVALRDQDHELPACCVLFSPWVDLREDEYASEALEQDALIAPHDLTLSVTSYLAGATDAADPRVSPLLAELSRIEPIQLFVGGSEILGPQAREFAYRARRAGTSVELIEVPGLFHDWPIFADLPESHHAVEAAGAFIRSSFYSRHGST